MSVQDIEIAIFLVFAIAVVATFMFAMREEERRHNVEIENIQRVPARVYADMLRRMEAVERKLKEKADRAELLNIADECDAADVDTDWAERIRKAVGE